MDDNVVAAMGRWPDVPDVYGWLSLSEQGQWRLHPNGSGWTPGSTDMSACPPGEPIESPQILGFINRNYVGDAQGRWYFQNGPQRVYVRLDATPYILHVHDTGLALKTHNGLPVQQVRSWWLDDQGKLYACTEHGPALISGRDSSVVFEALCTSSGVPLLTALETAMSKGGSSSDVSIALAAFVPSVGQVRLRTDSMIDHAAGKPAPLHFCPSAELATHLEFIPYPAP